MKLGYERGKHENLNYLIEYESAAKSIQMKL